MSPSPLDRFPPKKSETQRAIEVRIHSSSSSSSSFMLPPPRPTRSQGSQPSEDAGQQQRHSHLVQHSRVSKRRKSSRGVVSGRQASLQAASTSEPTESSSRGQGSTSTPSASFTPSTKRKIRDLNPEGDQCWHCQATPTQASHVIAIKDHELFNDWKRRGCLNLRRPEEPNNGIALCANCHINFDFSTNPGWFLLPTDLQFFIDFEIRDMERRRSLLQTEQRETRRSVPSPEQYREHQIRTREIDNSACGGLFGTIVFRDFLRRFPGPSFQPGANIYRSQPQPWAGDPMAVLSHAFRAALTRGLPQKTSDALISLGKLYNTHDDEIPPPPLPRTPAPSAKSPVDHGRSSPLSSDDDDDIGPSRPTHKKGRPLGARHAQSGKGKAKDTTAKESPRHQPQNRTHGHKRRITDMQVEDWEAHNVHRRRRAAEEMEAVGDNWDGWDDLTLVGSEAPPTKPHPYDEPRVQLRVFQRPPSCTSQDAIEATLAAKANARRRRPRRRKAQGK